MTDNKRTKVIVPKLLSIYDNAIDKSVMKTSIDIKSGKKTEENISYTITDVKNENIDKSFINDSINTITSSYNNKLFYKNLRNPDFTGCQVKGLEEGFKIVKDSINQSKQKNKLWFDFAIIIEAYEKSYDINAYILGIYYGMKAYTTEHILCLNKLFPLLKDAGLTKYNTFQEYCEASNYIKQDGEETTIDEDRYQKGQNDLLFGTHLLDEE